MCDPTGIPYVLFHRLLLNKPVSFPLEEPTSRQVGVTPVLPYVVQPYRASPYVLLHITPAGKDVASAAFLSSERYAFPVLSNSLTDWVGEQQWSTLSVLALSHRLKQGGQEACYRALEGGSSCGALVGIPIRRSVRRTSNVTDWMGTSRLLR